MTVSRITPAELEEFLSTQPRYLYTQTPEYARASSECGDSVEILGYRRDGGQLVGAAVVSYQPWKKIFHRATIKFGPVLNWDDADAVEGFFVDIRRYLSRKPSVLSLRVNPLLARRFYEDVEEAGENPAAARLDLLMEDMGGSQVPGDLYSDPTLQIRYAYTKSIEGMSLKELIASCGQVVRTGFNRWGTPGLSVRMLRDDEFESFVEMERHTAERTGMVMGSASAFSRYRELLTVLGPEHALLPGAFLNCEEYLAGIAQERAAIQEQVDAAHAKEEELAAEGKVLGKKQRNALKEALARIEVLDKRAAETEAIRDRAGNEVLLAAALFFASPTEVVYLLSAAEAEFQSYYGVYLIHRFMMEWAVERGMGLYNFFGISGDLTEDAPDAGVLHFKRQFNGDVEEYVGTYSLPIRPRLANRLGA